MSGDQLRTMRMEMGWSQKYLARVMGISRSSLAHWEQFRAPIPQGVGSAIRKAHRKMTKIVEELGDV